MNLPEKFEELRPHQVTATEEIVEHFRNGKRVVILDAPTGSGKTLIGEMVRQQLRVRQALYVCTTKSLQQQFLNDFTYAQLLKGRNNYPTLNRPEDWPEVSAADCNRSKVDEGVWLCDECYDTDQCPYRVAREEADLSSLAVLNTAYFLTITNYAGMFTDRDLVIVDEADELESELMRSIEVLISRGKRNWLQIDLPRTVNDPNVWQEWLTSVWATLKRKAGTIGRRTRGDRRKRRSLLELADKIEAIRPNLDDNWVVDHEDARRRRGEVERQHVRFRPVRVDTQAREWLWDHADRWLLMSATIISPAQMAKDLGLADDEWAAVTVPSSFPPHRRPIFLDRHVGPVTNRTETEALPKLVREIEQIANFHDERILLHTHSYKLTKHLAENLSLLRPILAYYNARDRDDTLEKWLATDDGLLLAPSFDRGIDLLEDKCRVQVICKAPYPYLGDKQVSKRLHSEGGQMWYTVNTVRSIVQATGRVMRSEDDWGATYILDGSVWKLLNEQGGLFPGWWREAVVKGHDVQSRELKDRFIEVRGG